VHPEEVGRRDEHRVDEDVNENGGPNERRWLESGLHVHQSQVARVVEFLRNNEQTEHQRADDPSVGPFESGLAVAFNLLLLFGLNINEDLFRFLLLIFRHKRPFFGIFELLRQVISEHEFNFFHIFEILLSIEQFIVVFIRELLVRVEHVLYFFVNNDRVS
jgi:hypothetical protein